MFKFYIIIFFFTYYTLLPLFLIYFWKIDISSGTSCFYLRYIHFVSYIYKIFIDSVSSNYIDIIWSFFIYSNRESILLNTWASGLFIFLRVSTICFLLGNKLGNDLYVLHPIHPKYEHFFFEAILHH